MDINVWKFSAVLVLIVHIKNFVSGEILKNVSKTEDFKLSLWCKPCVTVSTHPEISRNNDFRGPSRIGPVLISVLETTTVKQFLCCCFSLLFCPDFVSIKPQF